MGEGGDLGIPPLVLSRFVLDHLAHLPPARELIRNEPLPPMDIENLVVRILRTPRHVASRAADKLSMANMKSRMW
jgi:hypothetical protein